MKLNMGSLDRKIRTFVVAPLLVVGGLVVGPLGVLSVIAYGFAAVMVATSLAGSCFLYSIFGVSSCPISESSSASAG